MKETSKSFGIRKERGDFDQFLRGNGIDIGAGKDPLKVEVGSVKCWDRADGDAQLMPGVADNQFDFVYSSHCLEHMREVPEALRNWTRILKPGGFLYIVVPEYIHYEKMTWPSMLNPDHKQSFSFLITRAHVGRPNHYHATEDMFPLIEELGSDNIRLSMEDDYFNYNAGVLDQTRIAALSQLCFVAKKR